MTSKSQMILQIIKIMHFSKSFRHDLQIPFSVSTAHCSR